MRHNIKKLFNILICLIALIGLTACNKNSNEKTNEQKDDKFDEFLSANFKQFEWFDSNITFDQISDFSSDYEYFITTDGSVYHFDLEKKFRTTDKRYEKKDYSVNFKRFVRNRLVTENNDYYTMEGNKLNMVGYCLTNAGDTPCDLIYKSYPNIYNFAQDHLVSNGFVYNDGSIITIFKNNSKSLKGVVEELKELEQFEIEQSDINNEQFISGAGFIFWTNKSYYKMDIKKIESQYADEEDVYKAIPFRMSISDYYDKVYYFNGSVLLLKDDPSHIYISNELDGYWYGNRV